MIIFWVVWLVAVLLVLTFGAVILFGAPYMPTLKPQQAAVFKLLELRKGEVFVDLGCGDGTMLIAAAGQGLKAVGYEINPFLVLIAWARTRRYRQQVRIIWRSFWQADLSAADGVFVFLIEAHMKRLDRFLIRQSRRRPIKLVSHAFRIPGRRPAAKSGPMFLYRYR